VGQLVNGTLRTFRILLEQQAEVAQLAEELGVHLALSFQDQGLVAANSL